MKITELLKTKFIFLWFSQLLSQITVNLINFTIALIIFERTSSTAAISLIWFFYAIPALILGPFSGVITDLADKRKILLITNFIQAIIVFLYLTVKVKVWVIYSLIFLYSLVNQLYLPAEGATLPFLIPKNLYPFANILFMFTANATFLVGFALAGPLVRILDKENVFLVCGTFLLLAALAVYFLPKNLVGERKKITSPVVFFKKVKEGYLYFKGNPFIAFPLSLIAGAQIILGILIIIVPIFSKEILKIPLTDAGLVVLSPAGAGALIGGVLVTKKLAQRVRKKILISSGLGFSFFSFVFLGLIIPFLPQKERVIFSAIFAFLLGMAFVFLIIPSQTFIQTVTPKRFYGRIYGVLGFLITLASIMPILMIGTLVDLLGIKVILIAIGLLVGGVFLISLKEPYEIIKNQRI
ncbi:MAG: MFS transporter [Microgenomates group bacterium]